MVTNFIDSAEFENENMVNMDQCRAFADHQGNSPFQSWPPFKHCQINTVSLSTVKSHSLFLPKIMALYRKLVKNRHEFGQIRAQSPLKQHMFRNRGQIWAQHGQRHNFCSTTSMNLICFSHFSLLSCQPAFKKDNCRFPTTQRESQLPLENIRGLCCITN